MKLWDPTTEARILELLPELQQAASRFVQDAWVRGIALRVYHAYRPPEMQAAFYAQGRSPLNEVNQLRRLAGLGAISEAENRIITYAARNGLHTQRRAFDCVEIQAGRALWSNPRWEEIGALGEAWGFEWGGRWKFRDKPHFQRKG